MISRFAARRLILCVALTLLASCAKGPQRLATSRATDLIPADVTFALSIERPESLYARLHLEELIPMMKASARGWEGFFNLDSLRAKGLDTKRPILFAVLDTEPPSFMAALPGDGARLTRMIQDVMKKQSESVSVIATHNEIEILGGDTSPLTFFALEHHAVITTSDNPDSLPPVTVAQRILDLTDAQTLSSSEEFRAAAAKLPQERDISFYARLDPKTQLENAKAELTRKQDAEPEMLALLDALADLTDSVKGSAGAVNILPNGLSAVSVTGVEKGSMVSTFMRPAAKSDAFIRRMPGTPRFILSMNLNAPALWSWTRTNVIDAIEDASAEFTKAEAAVRDELGVELDRDLLKQIKGSGMLVINHVGMVGTDVVFCVQLDRPDAFKETLTRIIDVAKAKPGTIKGPAGPAPIEADEEAGVAFHKILMQPFAEVCCGVIDDHLVLTTTRARFAEIVQGKSGLADQVDYPALGEALGKSPASLFYFDLGLISDLLESFGAFIPQQQQGGPQMVVGALESLQLQHLLGVSYSEEDGSQSTFRIESGRNDFWKALMRVITGAVG